jgi:Rap1a immunity proteins
MMKKINMKHICSTLLVCSLIFPCEFAFAQEADEEEAVTGRELLADCEQGATATTPNQACMKYVFGLVQTVVMLQQMDPSKKLFCIDPTVVRLEEVTNKVTAALKAVPERLDEEAYVLVSEALNTSYPCSATEVI